MQNHEILRAAYRANGSFSIASATIFVAFGSWLAPAIGLPSAWPLVSVGLGLVPFGGWLFWLSGGPELSSEVGRSVSLLDAGWVIGTVVMLTGWPHLLNAAGQTLAIGIALVVTAFAVWQLIGARRIASLA